VIYAATQREGLRVEEVTAGIFRRGGLAVKHKTAHSSNPGILVRIS
jgi:hypothetical protein